MSAHGKSLRKLSHLIRVQHKWFLVLSYKDLTKWLTAAGLKRRRFTIHRRDSCLIAGFETDQEVFEWTKKFQDWGGTVTRGEHYTADEIPAATWEDFTKVCKQYEASDG
jgi:hypothetical protein